MSKHHSHVDTVFHTLRNGVEKGILHLSTTDAKLERNFLDIGNKKQVVNFGSCSYLGLEFDQRLRNGAIEAIENYGTQFSASRAYISVKYYAELEELFSRIFESSAIVAPTTTLGHISAIPVLVEDGDAVILDHQVHNSVHIASALLKPRGIPVDLIRHNRMDMLEDKIKTLRQKYKRIWYMADGIYSMYGDGAPMEEIYQLLDRYPEFHFYVDDAHGMSCYGKHGRGYVLSRKPLHPKMIVATSLAKAFATGGAVLVFPTMEQALKVRTCGGTMNTSGPIQPGQLGAAVACAKIHLSEEITEMQDALYENIKYANLLLNKYQLPLLSEPHSPISFVGVSVPKVGYNMVKRMLNDGFYVNLGIFPAVPMKNTGVRFTITRLHTFKQIEEMIGALAYHLPKALEEEDFSLRKIYQAFRMQPPQEDTGDITLPVVTKNKFNVNHYKTIEQVPQEMWDNLFASQCMLFDWHGLRFLEKSYKNEKLPENQWEFDYFIITDEANTPVVATFTTCALWKDDMLSPAAVSVQVEEKRKTDPYYLTTKIISTGSLLTEGEQVYINREHPKWKEALGLLIEEIAGLQSEYNAGSVILRDFHADDKELDDLFVANGFFKTSMPESFFIDGMEWNSGEEHLHSLSKGCRRHIKRYIQKHADQFEVEHVTKASAAEIEEWYKLYMNVKQKSLDLNTFTLPFAVFENMASDPRWDILTFRLKPEYDTRPERKPVAVLFSYLAGEAYNALMIGLDYNFQEEFKPYRQALYRGILRARQLGMKKVFLGVTASDEKLRLGAKSIQPVAYAQAKDHFNMLELDNISAVSAASVKIIREKIPTEA